MDGIMLAIFLVLLIFVLARNAASTPHHRSKEYARQFRSVRRSVLLRDGYRCRICGARGKLDVHHRTPRAQGGSNAPSNLVTLCRKCHQRMHGH